jgi:hypothetical protein
VANASVIACSRNERPMVRPRAWFAGVSATVDCSMLKLLSAPKASEISEVTAQLMVSGQSVAIAVAAHRAKPEVPPG